MSILLDALKKSEAQRQLGETPNLQTPVETAGGQVAQVRPWLLGAMLLSIAVVIALLVTRQFDEPDLSILGYSEIGEMEPATGASDPSESEDSGSRVAARTPVERISPTANQRQAEQGSNNDRKSQLRQSVSTYQPPPAATQSSRTPDVTSRLSSKRSMASLPASSKTEPARLPVTSQRKVAAEEAEQNQPPPTLTYWQLPQGIRDNMPDLKISVLVYAANPEDRFILMDGQRLREGDDAGGGLDLKEVRRDGAVFTYRKYTFLLPN